MENKKNDKVYIIKLIISIAAIILCLLGLFKIISPDITIPIVLIMLAVIIGVFESMRDYRRGKKGWIWVDVVFGVALIALVIVDLIK